MITIEQARERYHEADSVHDFDHVLRVYTLAMQLAEEEGADQSIVHAAALLHDISRAQDESLALNASAEHDHAIIAAQEARRILKDEPADFVDAVAHAIEAHRFRNNIEPQTIEAQVLFDADKLDAIGAVGVARAFAYGAILDLPLWGDVSPDYAPGKPGEPHSAHHEFHVKLKKIKDRLYTQGGRRYAEGRHQFMLQFFEQMSAEIAGRC